MSLQSIFLQPLSFELFSSYCWFLINNFIKSMSRLHSIKNSYDVWHQLHEIETSHKYSKKDDCSLTWSINRSSPSSTTDMTSTNTMRTKIETPTESTILNEEEKTSSNPSVQCISGYFFLQHLQISMILLLFIRLSVKRFNCFDRTQSLMRTCISLLVQF